MVLERARIIGGFFVLMITIGLPCAPAATILSFQPDSASSSPEILFHGNGASPAQPPSFTTGAGSTGNGDGALLSAAVSPGLTISTPLSIAPGILGEQSHADGSTTFYDVTLQFTGLPADAAANSFAVGPGESFLTQNLGIGTFTFSSSKVGGGPGVPLLSGTISDALLTGLSNSDTGSEISSTDVTYTGGVIYTALEANGGNPDAGSESISLLNISPTLSIDNTTTYVSDFSANATGQFSVPSIPEPTCLGLLSAAVICLAGRYRRQDPPLGNPPAVLRTV